MKKKTPAIKVIQGEKSWRFASDKVEAFLSVKGGHLAPVTFKTAAGPIQPFPIAPWADEKMPAGTPDVLRILRGDFFCAPFGGNASPWRGEKHVLHGETASNAWKLLSCDSFADGVVLRAELKTRTRPGTVTKRLELRTGETNIYSEHELRGFSGPMCLGHHAMLEFKSPGRIAVSPWRLGQVTPSDFETAAQGGYFALKTGAPFKDLKKVPLNAGGTTDLTRYPAREGYEDLVMVSSRPGPGLAWTAVTFPEKRYVWFAIKDPKVLASTVLWHSNAGRHYAPWSGRHRRVLGLEEVTSYFAFGLAESAAPNPVSRKGVPTVLKLDPKKPLRVPYVMGVVAIPKGFDTVRRVTFHRDHIKLHAAGGAVVRQAMDLSFFEC